MRIINYSLGNRYDKFGKIESTQIILARPGKRALGVLNGVREDTCSLTINLNNTWVLDFDVDRVVNGGLSNYYDRIEQKMELHLPGYGWFKITEEPVMSNDGNIESLSVHAESLEIEFQQYVFKGFEVNTGTQWSLEYLAADNVFYYDDDKSYPFFRENVRFYRDTTAWEEMMDAFEQTDKSEQALLGLISQHPCIMDSWRINYDLSNFDNAIDTVVTLGEQAGRNMKVLESYSGQFSKFAMEGLDQQAQQTAFSLTRVWPELLNYITAINIDCKCYDETHDGDYTLDEIIHLELQRQKDLSLLDVVANHYGWHVGFVDDSVVADSDVDDDRIPLSQKTGKFEVDSQNAYTFMTQEMASYFRCIFVFDTYEKTVNAYNINNLGVDTNIFLSFHNIQNSVERSGNDTIHTAFYIQGGDELDPLEANFGENEIWDLSYYMNTQHFSQSTIDKYNAWLEYRESQRQLYMNKSVKYRNQLDVVEEIYDRVPVDGADTTQYGTMSDEELEEEKQKYIALARGIEATYVDDFNEFDIDILRENDPDTYKEYIVITGSILSSPTDALDYIRYDASNDSYIFVNGNDDTSDYRLGNIDIYIHNRKIANGDYVDDDIDSPEIAKKKTDYKKQKDYLDNYIYDFDTYGDAYGVAELKNRLDDLQNKIDTLYSKGYAVEPTQEEREADPYRASQYDLYIKYKTAYDECKTVLENRQRQYDDASDELTNISSEMLEIKKDVAIENERFGFTEEEIELIKKYLYYTDYTNENMIITSISTPEEIVETEYQLIKDAQEELYAVAHPQWIWSTSQDNLFLIAENDDWYGTLPHPSYKDWCEDLVIGNFLHVGFREDDHLPDYVYVDSSSNQVKLRLISVGLNPFMIEPTIDLTFSTMIQYKSRRNDFVDLLGLASGVGDHQITATFQSKKLDDTFQIDSSFVMKLLNNGAFANYAAGSIMNAGALDSLVVPTIHAAEINVGQITGDIASFMETYTQYLDADTIVARILNANTANFNTLSTNILSANNAQIFNSQLANSTVDAQWVHSQIAAYITVADLQAGNIVVSDDLKIVSDNGLLEMDGQHLIISIDDGNGNLIDGVQLGYGDSSLPYLKFSAPDSNGDPFTGIQLGYASNGLPNLVIRDENGNDGIVIGLNSIGSGNDAVIKPSITIYDDSGVALFTSRGVNADNTVTGVQAAAIADGLIVNDMVHTQTLSKDKMNFNVMEVGDDIIIEQMTYTDGSKFGNEYTMFEQNITNAVAEFVDVLPSVELTGRQTFTVDEDSNILPNKITIYANPRNGFIPYTWTIDGVDASQYVSSDGLSIDIPNTVMANTSASVNSGEVIERNYTISSFGHGVPEGDLGFSYLDLDTLIVYFVTIVQEEDLVTGEVISTNYEWSIHDVLVPSPVEATDYSLQFGSNSNILHFRYANNIFIQINPLSNSKVVRCQNQDNSSYDTITIFKLPTYNSATTTVILDNDSVQFATSTTGVPMFRQTATCKIIVYKGSTQSHDFTINNIVTPTGVTATVSSNSIEIIVSPTAAISNTSIITFDVVMGNGTTISKSIAVNRLISTNSETTVVEYSLQTSNLECDENATWSEIRPTASAGEFLWYRYRTDYSNGDPSKYSKPHYISTITGLINMTDAVNKSITNKIWQDDFETYDTQVIRHRESEITQTVDEISMRVSETSSDLGALTSEYTQTVGEIRMTISNISDDLGALSDSQGQTASELLDLVGQYQNTVADFNNLHNNYQDTVAALNNLSSEYSDTANQFIALRTEYDQTIDSINTTITGITTDYDALSSSVTQSVGEISSTVTSISGDLLALSGQYQGTVSDLATLLQNYSGTVQTLTALSDNYNQTVEDFGILSTNVTQGFGEINQTVSALSGDLTTLNSNYQQTAQALSTLNNNFASLSNRYNQTVDDFAILSSSIDQRFDSINLTVAGLSDNISDLDEQYSENIQNLSDTISINYAQALDAVQNLRTDTDVEFLAVRSDFRVELGQISSTVTGITTDLDALSTSYTQTAQDFSWLFVKSDPTDPASGMVLTSDGLNLFNSSISVTNLIDSIAEGALQVRSTNSGSISTDNNEPLQNDQSQTLDATGNTTLYFDNGYPDSSPHRSEKPWTSFLGHKIEVNPFSVELSDAIINSTTQFVVYKTGNPFDHQYVVWYDKEMRCWKSICINKETNLTVASPSTNRYEITPTQNGDLHVVFRYDGDITNHRVNFNRHNFDISGTLTYGYSNGDINQLPYNLIQGNYGIITSTQATDYIILEFTIPSAVKNTTYGLYARIQDMGGGSDKPFDVITCTQAAGYGSTTNWEWDNDSHMVVAEFTKESDGDVYYQSYYPAKTYQAIQYVAMLQTWGDSILTETTTINGGSITTGTVTTDAINAQGIQSKTYIDEYNEIPRDNEYTFIPTSSGAASITMQYSEEVPNCSILVSMDANIASAQITKNCCAIDDSTNTWQEQQNLSSSDISSNNGVSQFSTTVSSSTKIVTSLQVVINLSGLVANNNYTLSTKLVSNSPIEDIPWDSVKQNNTPLPIKTELVPSIYSNTGTWINLENSGFIRSKNFAIDANGNAYFKGELQAASGSFSGEITASAGRIGGWDITSDSISKDVSASSSGDGKRQYVYINSNFYSSGTHNPVFAVNYDNAYTFYVRSNGELYASNANITGNITATTLKANTSFVISTGSVDKECIKIGTSPITNIGNTINMGDITGGNYIDFSTAGAAIFTTGALHIGGRGNCTMSYDGGTLNFYVKKQNIITFSMNTGVISNFNNVPISLILHYNGNWYPSPDCMMNWGVPNNAWSGVFSYNFIQQSDGRLKDITSKNRLDEDFVDLFMSLRPVEYKWKIEQKKDKKHFGLIAQEVEESFNKNGFASSDYAVVNYIEHDEDEYGKTDSYSLDYNELHMLTMAMTQRQERYIKELQSEVNELKQLIKQLTE